jgi:hypothetical protein
MVWGGHLAKQKGAVRAAERRHREAIDDRLVGIADGAPGDEIGIVGHRHMIHSLVGDRDEVQGDMS